MEGLECTEICTEISYTVSIYVPARISVTAGIVVMFWVPDVDFYIYMSMFQGISSPIPTFLA